MTEFSSHRTDLRAYAPSGFIGKYSKLVKDEVIPYQYDVLWDKRENTEKSHVVQNFINAGKAIRGEDTGDGFYGMVFQDSDAAKWVEAAAFSLVNFPDSELENKIDELIDIIADAQDEDGYLDTYFTVKDRDKRFTNLLEGHELYCSGHMIEAAAAYYKVTGKRKLLDVMLRNMEHIYDHFVTKGEEGYPGHPEIEQALIKLYRTTGDKKALELASHFVDVRGKDPDFFIREKAKRDWTVWGNDGSDRDYQQNGAPVREQKDATGHAVRAVYLYAAMAELLCETGDKSLEDACHRLWDSITKKRMYITGGIGSTVEGEAFTVDYDLPTDTAYCETCASLGLMFFAAAMLEHEADSRYADVMERAFYNTALAGMQLDGKSFFYVNVLESLPGISGKTRTHRHTLTTRPGWYACACCPPNLARVIMSFGEYAFGENEDTGFVHLYAAGEVKFGCGLHINIDTEYPYSDRIVISAVKGGNIAVRIPGWSQKRSIALNGTEISPETVKGYAYISLNDGDTLTLTLDCTPRFNFASPRIPSVAGMVCLSKGPLVYCFEGKDNDGDVVGLSLDTASGIEIGSCSELGTDCLRVTAYRDEEEDEFYSFEAPAQKKVKAAAIPYYAWCNRGENQMRVWMRKK